MATITGNYSQHLDFVQAATGSYTGGKKGETDKSIRIGSGTTVNCVDLCHHTLCDTTNGKSVAGAANTDYDLRGLLDPEGAALATLAEVAYLKIEAYASNADAIEIKPSAANGWTALLKDPTDTIILEPGAAFTLECWLAAAYAVDNTHKSINVLNQHAATTAYFGITLLGRSA